MAKKTDFTKQVMTLENVCQGHLKNKRRTSSKVVLYYGIGKSFEGVGVLEIERTQYYDRKRKRGEKQQL